jgi:hypothetical protein
MADGVNDSERRSKSWLILLIPAAFLAYAIIGTLWHPFFGVDDNPDSCNRGNWLAIAIVAIVVAVMLLIYGSFWFKTNLGRFALVAAFGCIAAAGLVNIFAARNGWGGPACQD